MSISPMLDVYSGTQNYILFGILVLGLVLGYLGFQENLSENSTNWNETTLTEVDTGEKFSISELEKPLLVETFAVWCPTCTRQQQEKGKLKQQRGNLTSVSLNIDPNEDKEQISRHKEENGFDWRYAVAPPKMVRSLRQEFGPTILNPPSAPIVLVCSDGSSELLPTGLKPADQLSDMIDERC